MSRLKNSSIITGNQRKCLTLLSTRNGYTTRPQLAELMGMVTGHAGLVPILGSPDKEARDKAEERAGRKTLLTLGLVMVKAIDTEGKVEQCYKITQQGRDILAQLSSS